MLTAMARVWLRGLRLVLIMLVCWVSASAIGYASTPAELTISIQQQADAHLRVKYKLNRPQKTLAFTATRDGYHRKYWTVEADGFRIVKRRRQIWLERKDGKYFNSVTISAAPAEGRLTKQYQPISRYGDGGVMVYTGHFWPVNIRKERANAVFNFYPTTGSKVVAFGQHVATLENWRSPMDHPAFVYMGPLEPVETAEVMAVVDPNAPRWIIDEFYELTPRAFRYLSQQFGFSHNAKPNLFLAAPLGEEDGRLSYAGDALPGQFQVTLVGAAWSQRTDQALNIFRSSTVHEAVHLWQASARPVRGDLTAWIHEGAADAIAAETLLAINYWDQTDHANYFIDARAECAAGLEYGSLAGAERRARYRALYACGHVIAEAVSIAEDKPVADFWRAFILQAQQDNGYSENTYFDLVLDRTGDPEFVGKLREFVRTSLANPDREIGRLLATAHSTSRTDPLAPAQGH